MFAYKYMTQLCSHPLCQQENSLVLCLAWIITKLFGIRMWGCDLTAIFSFPFSVFNTFQKLKIPNLFFFLMLISNGNIAKQSAQYLCFVHLLPSLKINWLYSTLFSIFLHLDIIALWQPPQGDCYHLIKSLHAGKKKQHCSFITPRSLFLRH